MDYVTPGTPLAGYDCIIIPGTKNTIEDLAELVRTGTDREIKNARNHGVPVIGICGGYQMLGRTLVDAGFESSAGTYEGLGLLDGITRFASYDKTTTQVTRKACAVPPILSSMGDITGYEIHIGVTEPGCDREALQGDGRVSGDGLVFGTYLHGLFQNPSAANALLTYLSKKKGIPFELIPLFSEDPYEVLADLFEQHVDMDAVQAMLTG